MIDSIENIKRSKSLDESVSEKICGILYFNDFPFRYHDWDHLNFAVLIYYALKSDTKFFIDMVMNPGGLHATKEEIYYSSCAKIKKLFRRSGLFSRDLVAKRENYCDCIQTYNDMLMDAGAYGLYDTHMNKQLITREQLKKRGFDSIKSLLVDKEGGLLMNSSAPIISIPFPGQEIVRIKKRNNNYTIGESVRKYRKEVCLTDGHAVIIPGTNHIITSNNCSYLDLDGRIISETRVYDGRQLINYVKILTNNNDEQTAELIYFLKGPYENNDDILIVRGLKRNIGIMYASIDYKNSRITAQVKPLLTGLRSDIYQRPFELIREKKIHEQLIEKGIELDISLLGKSSDWMKRLFYSQLGRR